MYSIVRWCDISISHHFLPVFSSLSQMELKFLFGAKRLRALPTLVHGRIEVSPNESQKLLLGLCGRRAIIPVRAEHRTYQAEELNGVSCRDLIGLLAASLVWFVQRIKPVQNAAECVDVELLRELRMRPNLNLQQYLSQRDTITVDTTTGDTTTVDTTTVDTVRTGAS